MPHAEAVARARRALGAGAVLVIAAGLVLRLVPLGLPGPLVKYGGSILWGAMVWLLVAAAAPRRPRTLTVLAAGTIALATELFRLVHHPVLDAFRLTLPGALLLGRIFAPANLVAYAIGIAGAAWIAGRVRRCAGGLRG